jgi:hypothetical protein
MSTSVHQVSRIANRESEIALTTVSSGPSPNSVLVHLHKPTTKDSRINYDTAANPGQGRSSKHSIKNNLLHLRCNTQKMLDCRMRITKPAHNQKHEQSFKIYETPKVHIWSSNLPRINERPTL